MGAKSTKRAGYWLDKKAIREALGRVNARVIEQTAKDIKSNAERLLSTRVRRTKRGLTRSRPGEPPRQFTGRLRNSIRYAWDNGNHQFIIGPERLGGNPSSNKPVPNVLQFGGNVTLRKKVWVPTPVRKFSPDVIRDKNRNKYGEKRSRRPLTERGKKKGGERYKYFYKRIRWEHASEAPDFIRWCESRRTQWETFSAVIEPRPYMNKALKRETTPERMEPRFERARAYFAKGFKRK